MNNAIVINLKKDNILIKIEENATQEEIIEELTEKLKDLKQLYKEEKTPIAITGKVLRNKEIDQIRELIKENIDVEIEFDSPRDLGLHGIIRAYSKEIKTSETKFYKTSVRSGQKIEYEGSLVIIGDVNDGAEIIAGENIIVLGDLRGLAHAGAKGNKKAIISASTIDAPQLRISNIVKEREKEEIEEQKVKTYVYINEKNEIVLE